MFEEYLQKISDLLGYNEFETFQFSDDVYKDKYGKKEKNVNIRIIIDIIILISYTALSYLFYIQFKIDKMSQIFISMFMFFVSLDLFLIEPILLNRYKRKKTLLNSSFVYLTKDNRIIFTKCEKIDVIKIKGKIIDNEDNINFATQYSIYEVLEVTKKIIDDKYISLYGRINYTTFIETKKETKIDEGYIHGIDIENVFYNFEENIKNYKEIKTYDFEKEYSKILKKLDSFLEFEENWDGYGAKPFNKNLLMFVGEFIPQLKLLPEVYPTASGEIQLEYNDDNNIKYLEIVIKENKKMDLFIIENKDNEIEFNDIDFSVDRINEEIEKFINIK